MSGSFNIGTWLIVGIGLSVLFLWFWKKYIKPASLNHDSTIAFCGGLGSGKSYSSVRVACKTFKRVHFRWWFSCKWRKFKNRFRDEDEQLELDEEPLFFSNIPVKIGRKRFCNRLTREHMIFKYRIPVGSVILIDELPKFCNQYQWGDKDVQTILDEWISYFRHYIDGLLVVNAQSLDEIVAPIRRKLNSYYYCSDFRSILGFVSRVNIIRSRVGDMDVSLNSEYVEDHTKATYGLLIPRRYDSRCYRHRYDAVVLRNDIAFQEETTNHILRFKDDYVSVLDPQEGKKNG